MNIARTIAVLAFAAAVVLLVFMAGHHRGRRSCRNEYPDGWDAGQAAERDRWEDATGTTWDVLARWQSARTPEPDFDPAFPPATLLLADDAAERLAEADAALTGKPLAPDVPVGIVRFEGHLSEEEAEEWKRRWLAAQGKPPELLPDDPEWDISEEEFEAAKRDLIERHGAIPPSLQRVADRGGRFRRIESGPPVVADITDAVRWRPPGHTEVPTVDGVVVTPWPAPAADWDVLAGRALPDYAAAALGGHRTVDELVDSIVMRAVRS